jgi:hypothetical protein
VIPRLSLSLLLLLLLLLLIATCTIRAVLQLGNNKCIVQSIAANISSKVGNSALLNTLNRILGGFSPVCVCVRNVVQSNVFSVLSHLSNLLCLCLAIS